MRSVALLVVLAACGSDDIDLTGVYAVDSSVGAEPCGTDEPIPFAEFVRFQKMEFLGTEFFAYDGCAEADAVNCTSIGGLIGGFFEPIDNGWLGFTSFSSGGGGSSCLLGIIEQTAILEGTTITIEVTSYEQDVDGLSADDCSPDEAERRGDAMPCVEHSLVGATKL
jgi:hypothetical protein